MDRLCAVALMLAAASAVLAIFDALDGGSHTGRLIPGLAAVMCVLTAFAELFSLAG